MTSSYFKMIKNTLRIPISRLKMLTKCDMIWNAWCSKIRLGPFKKSLTHWSRVTYICVSKLMVIGRHQVIIWTNAGISLTGHSGINFSLISMEMHTFSFKKVHLKMPRPQYLNMDANEYIYRCRERANMKNTVDDSFNLDFSTVKWCKSLPPEIIL